MDETTKVIIATLSGFIIAFFAEPVKNYFTVRAKLHNLRIALYKEMIHNYITINTLNAHRNDEQPEITLYLTRGFRIECFKNALQNELSLFYQLNETSAIIVVQGIAEGIINFSNDVKSLISEPFSNRELFLGIQTLSKEFQDTFAFSFYTGMFDLKILKRLSGKEAYQQVLEKGKEASSRANAKHDEE